MKILFAISILALFGLLWTSVAIARHVRRARRRRSRVLKSVDRNPADSPTPPRLDLVERVAIPEPEITFVDPLVKAPSAKVIPAPPPPPPVLHSFEARAIEPETISIQAAVPSTVAEGNSDEPEQAAQPVVVTVAKPVPEPVLAQSEAASHPAEPAADVPSEPELVLAAIEHPYAEPGILEQHATMQPESELAPVEAVSVSSNPTPPPPRRPFRAVPPKHPLASLIPQIHRPDWAYFNKDMGDLSDPAPRAPRLRPTNQE